MHITESIERKITERTGREKIRVPGGIGTHDFTSLRSNGELPYILKRVEIRVSISNV